MFLLTSFRGALYFSAHAVDNLLFYNPDLSHDLYVYRCVILVVFTSLDQGEVGNVSHPTEDGLEEATAWMTGAKVNYPIGEKTALRIGAKNMTRFVFYSIPNAQILYFRFPDGGHAGQGYTDHNMESLKKLYTGEINSVTTIDGSANYTLDHIKETIGVILHQSQAHTIRILNHKAVLPNDSKKADADHADHIISARIVLDVVKGENITSNVTS